MGQEEQVPKKTEAKPKTAAPKPLAIWDRPEPASRAALEPLSREKIVRAALSIADREGLEAVSLRNVGAALGAGPMRLYGYLETKEELLELMADAVYAEMIEGGKIRGGWRKALRTVASRLREAAHRHAWFIALVGGRPHQGPNALAFLEMSLAALSGQPGFERIDDVLHAGSTVNAYAIGAIQNEAADRRASASSGLDKEAWQLSTAPYIFRMLETGRFPTLAKVVGESGPPQVEKLFDQGLECVLDGIATRLPK